MEAGLTPDPERTQRTVNSKVEQMSFSQTLLKNIHNASGETSISSTNQSQRASSTDKCPPNTPPKQKWAVVTSKESHPDKCDAERGKFLPQLKRCGKLNLSYCPFKIFVFGWTNLGMCLCALTYYMQVKFSCIRVLNVVGVCVRVQPILWDGMKLLQVT